MIQLYAIVALASALLGGFGAWRVQDWRFDAREKQRIEMEAKERIRKEERIDQAAAAHEKDKQQIRTRVITVTKEVEREVEKPVYRDACLPPSGVRIVNDLIEGKDSGEPAAAVPGPGQAR